jgi:hypothetical protein
MSLPDIQSTVGRSGQNKREDVMCIQSILAHIKLPTDLRGGRQQFYWPGKIDGRNSAALEDAITLFQRSQRLMANGRIGRNCPTNVRLEREAPTKAKRLCARDFVAPSPASSQKHQSFDLDPDIPSRRKPLGRDRTLEKLVLDDKMRGDLTELRLAVYNRLGIGVGFSNAKADPQGFVSVTITPEEPLATNGKMWLRQIAGDVDGLRAGNGSPLIVTSSHPMRFRAADMRAGPAGHHLFTTKVGRTGSEPHDVAALQAALAHIKHPTHGKMIWTGGVDGANSADLLNAVITFQIAAGIAPTGAIGPGAPAERALIAMLPDDLKRLTGVKGLPLAYVGGANTAQPVPYSRLPVRMRAAVERLSKATEAVLGLPVVLRQGPRQMFTHITVAIGLGDGLFLDDNAKTLPRTHIPDAVKAVFDEALKDDPELGLWANAAPGQVVLAMVADAGLLDEMIMGPLTDESALAKLGTTSILVGRPLEDPIAGLFAGHLFIVTGARRMGDPDATVYSFGQTATELLRPTDPTDLQRAIIPRLQIRENMMGRVEEVTGPYPGGKLSTDTNQDDINFWSKLTDRIDVSGDPSLPREVSPIIAPESSVRWYAENVVMDFAYQLLPESKLGSNSNAVAQAVANRASEHGPVPLPGGGGAFGYPGASNWAEVDFGGIP